MTNYISENKDRFVNELLDLLRIPSVSADPKFKADVFKAAEFLKEKLETAGADKVELSPTKGFPVNPGGAMPAVNGCHKQDYTVVIVVGLPVTH